MGGHVGTVYQPASHRHIAIMEDEGLPLIPCGEALRPFSTIWVFAQAISIRLSESLMTSGTRRVIAGGQHKLSKCAIAVVII